jgi:hypothetical protein
MQHTELEAVVFFSQTNEELWRFAQRDMDGLIDDDEPVELLNGGNKWKWQIFPWMIVILIQ